MNIKNRIIAKLKYELGITDLVNENKSLYFILDNCLDITKIPPTRDPELRNLQKCDALLLAIFDNLCQKYGLTYWLHWGTLLGAYRHKGFIPWDDDIDIAMPRSDINKVIPLMKEEIESLGLSIEYSKMHPLRGLVLSYKEKEVGLWIDIFPLDICVTNNETDKIHAAIIQYREYYWGHKHSSAEILMKKKEEIFNQLPKGDIKYYISSMEIREGVQECFNYTFTDIYPLSKISFEGYELNAPAKTPLFLEKSYGKDYMKFPHEATNNHGQSNSFAKRASIHGIDMNETYEFLQNIYNLTKI